MQGIGDAIWACGALGHHPGSLVGAVLSDLHKRGAEYILESWSAIIWGLTQVGEDTAPFLQLVHHMVSRQTPSGIRPSSGALSSSGLCRLRIQCQLAHLAGCICHFGTAQRARWICMPAKQAQLQSLQLDRKQCFLRSQSPAHFKLCRKAKVCNSHSHEVPCV